MQSARSFHIPALVAVLLAGCGEPPADVTDLATLAAALPQPAPRTLLIGLDGADWKVMRPLMAEGKLPVLSALVATGTSGDLRSIEPMISPALWTSVMTGVVPERHGIRDFVYKEPGSYAQPIVNATIRQRLALWNILSGVGRTVGIVDWYATWPAEQVNGFIVSDRIKTLGPNAEGVTFPGREFFGDTLTDPEPVGSLSALTRMRARFDTLPAGLDKALREDLYRFRIARDLYRTHRPDFFAFYLKGLDAVGHFYWKYHEPAAEVFDTVDPAEIALYGAILADYYELCDQLLGSFLEHVDDDVTLLVISDHGFRAFGRPDNLIFDVDRLLAEMGLLEFEEPSMLTERSARRIRMAGTRAYTHEGTQIVSVFGRRERPVYLNVAGREPQGLIEPGARESALEQIAERLEALRTDLETPMFTSVRRNPNPAPATVQQEPDLFLTVNPAIVFDYDVLVDGKPLSLFDDLIWEYGNISGTHRTDGILIAVGPGIRAAATIEDAGLLDVAPTLLRLAGAPVPRDLDGEVLEGLFEESAAREDLRVASYETLIERGAAPAESAPLDETYRERLRALGYVQ